MNVVSIQPSLDIEKGAFNTGCGTGCQVEDTRLSCNSLFCTSCTVGELALKHKPGVFCFSGNYYRACGLYFFLTMCPVIAAAYVLGPAVVVFLIPAIGGLFRWVYGCFIRRGIRSKYEIQGNCCSDFLHAYLLEPCSLYTLLRETDLREKQIDGEDVTELL